MDLRRIRYFVAVAEELNFHRAADRLYVTQPVVSEHVRKLETALGVQLLDRSPQFVRLTEAGTAFLVDARRLLAHAAEIEDAARRTGDMSAARLRVGLSPDLLPPTLPTALRTFRELRPPGQVEVQVDGCRHLLDDVRRNRLDAAIVMLPAPVGALRVRKVAVETAAVLCVRGERPSGGSVTLTQLAREPLLVLARDINPGFHDTVTGGFVAAGLHAQLVDHAAASLEQVMLDVTATGLRAIVPASAGERLMMLDTTLTPIAGGLAAPVAVVTRDEAPGHGLATFIEAVAAPRKLQVAA